LSFFTQLHDTFNIYDEEKGKEVEYKVSIKVARTINMSVLNDYLNRGTSVNGGAQNAIQALDVVLRNPAALRLVLNLSFDPLVIKSILKVIAFVMSIS
jgi:hypothetical protein